MKRISLFASAFFFGAMAFISCTKSDDNQTCAAGDGGNTQIVVFALHNGDTIINSAQHPDSAIVNWTDPNNNNQKVYVGEAGEDHIHLTNLKCGTYGIALYAYDTAAGMRYTGTATVSFTKTSGEVDTAITVH